MESSQPQRNPRYTEGRGSEPKPGAAPDSDQAELEQWGEKVGCRERGEDQAKWTTAAAEQKGMDGGVEGEDEDIERYGVWILPASSVPPTASSQAVCHSHQTTTDSACHAQAGGSQGLVFQYPESFEPAVLPDHSYAAASSESPGSAKVSSSESPGSAKVSSSESPGSAKVSSSKTPGSAKTMLWQEATDTAQEREPKPAQTYDQVFTGTPSFHRLAAYATPFPKTHPAERKKLQARRRFSPAFQQWRAPVRREEEEEVEEELVQVENDAIVLSLEDTQVEKRPHVIPWSKALQVLEGSVHHEHEKVDADMIESLARMELDVSSE